MRRLTPFVVAALWAVGPCIGADATPPFSSFFGTWKVVKIAGAASVTESQQSANAAIDTEIHISANLIATYSKHDTCKPHDTKVTEVDTSQVLESEFGTRMSDLYLPKGTLQSRVIYLDAGCAFAIAINRTTLLWPMGNGYIYVAVRSRV